MTKLSESCKCSHLSLFKKQTTDKSEDDKTTTSSLQNSQQRAMNLPPTPQYRASFTNETGQTIKKINVTVKDQTVQFDKIKNGETVNRYDAYPHSMMDISVELQDGKSLQFRQSYHSFTNHVRVKLFIDSATKKLAYNAVA